MTEYGDVRPVSRISEIVVPDLLEEGTGIQGFAFSRKFISASDFMKYAPQRTQAEQKLIRGVAEKAWKAAEESTGGPCAGENYVSISISDDHPNAGSKMEKIYLYFDKEQKYLRLWGYDRPGERFPKGETLSWDMNGDATNPENWIETVPTDAWDNLLLVNKSGDAILIDNIKIVHSSITIVDWPTRGQKVWLDGSTREKYGIIGLADQILLKKLEAISSTIRWVPQLHWAVLELGKTDGKKYGTISEWCSEFASWCLRKAGWWNAPKPSSLLGNIGSKTMENYFKDIGRMFTKQQILDGEYTLTEGDYLRFDNHSALFIRYEDDGRAVTDPLKRFISIDGNRGARVTLTSGDNREIKDLISVGSTR